MTETEHKFTFTLSKNDTTNNKMRADYHLKSVITWILGFLFTIKSVYGNYKTEYSLKMFSCMNHNNICMMSFTSPNPFTH